MKKVIFLSLVASSVGGVVLVPAVPVTSAKLEVRLDANATMIAVDNADSQIPSEVKTMNDNSIGNSRNWWALSLLGEESSSNLRDSISATRDHGSRARWEVRLLPLPPSIIVS
jgi:hypothetical protein